LARDFGTTRFGSEGCVIEELVAELGAAFLCADLDLTLEPREEHAAYVADCGGTEMKSQHKVWLCATIFAAASFLLPRFTRAQNHATRLSLDGLWLTDGYGELIEFKGNDLRVYEITNLSCIPSGKASRKTAASAVDEIVFAADDDAFRIVPGPSQDTLWFHEDGTVQNIQRLGNGRFTLAEYNAIALNCGVNPLLSVMLLFVIRPIVNRVAMMRAVLGIVCSLCKGDKFVRVEIGINDKNAILWRRTSAVER